MKSILFIILTLIGYTSYGQKDFKWDIIIDSLDGTQKELYSKTKVFIAENWVSANVVIQDDDKESGIIIVKGVIQKDIFFTLNEHTYVFTHTVKFLIKDNKCRIIINNVNCTYARCQKYDWPLMPVSDTYPEKKGVRITGMSEENYIHTMRSLKKDLHQLYKDYKKYIKTNKTTTDW